MSLLVAIGVNADGFREILGIREGAKEDKGGWSAFLCHLVDRGLEGVELVASDACRGLVESLAEYLPEARWQRCVVHFYRNIFSHVPATPSFSGKIRDVAKMLKAIHAQEDRAAAEGKARTVIGETLTYYAFADSPSTASWRRSLRESDRCAAAARWIKLKTNNRLERLMREIRRRTKVVGAFPDGQSCLNLAASRLRHIAGTQWSTRRYMNMDPLNDLQLQANGAAVA